MNLSKIHHIAIIVSDYETAKDFYVNKLNFSVIRENYRPERKDWKLDLRVNEHTELEIFAEENPPKRVNRPEASPNPRSPRTCHIKKVCTFQVQQKKKKSVLEKNGSGDTER